MFYILTADFGQNLRETQAKTGALNHLPRDIF